jgi:hypothetical protein
MLTKLGPSFIKAGQVLASRPDIIREDYMNELCILQDDVPPFPDEQVYNVKASPAFTCPLHASLHCKSEVRRSNLFWWLNFSRVGIAVNVLACRAKEVALLVF